MDDKYPCLPVSSRAVQDHAGKHLPRGARVDLVGICANDRLAYAVAVFPSGRHLVGYCPVAFANPSAIAAAVVLAYQSLTDIDVSMEVYNSPPDSDDKETLGGVQTFHA